MKRLLILVLFICGALHSQQIGEVHCKHFLYGMPLGTPNTNDLIIRDCYAMSSNDNTKFADWVCYRLTKKEITGTASQSRNWKPDPWLDPSETLEPDDYQDAHDTIHTDRGHQAPLASFKGTDCWEDTNYLSNITPQKSDLNQGPWKKLEDVVRNYIKDSTDPDCVVWVITGPVYGDNSMKLPMADEFHRVPIAYWKIIATKVAGHLVLNACLMPQDADRGAAVSGFLVSVDLIEQSTGLDFFWELDDSDESELERLPAFTVLF